MPYIILKRGDIIRKGDEYYFGDRWVKTKLEGTEVTDILYRRYIPIGIIKAAYERWEKRNAEVTSSLACFEAGIKWALRKGLK